jgi:hypothetical protein
MSLLLDRTKMDYVAIAKLLRIDPASAHRWISGKAFPTPEHIDKLAKLFKIEPHELFK